MGWKGLPPTYRKLSGRRMGREACLKHAENKGCFAVRFISLDGLKNSSFVSICRLAHQKYSASDVARPIPNLSVYTHTNALMREKK